MLALLLRGLSAFTALLPWRALPSIGAAIGWLAGSVLRVRRRAVEAAMVRAGVDAPRAAARAMYRRLGTGALELFWMAGAGAGRRDAVVDRHVVLSEPLRAALEMALARGPVVIAASHTANWELVAYAAARLLATRGRGLAVVAKPLSVGEVHSFIAALRRSFGLEVVEPSGAAFAARRALRRGDVVAMMIDQVPDRAEHGVRATFLGAEALCDRAPAAVARTLGATTLVVGARRTGMAQNVELLATLPPSLAPAGEATARATEALDRFVREAPADWLWLHRRWRGPRSASASASAPEPLAGSGSARLVASSHPG